MFKGRRRNAIVKALFYGAVSALAAVLLVIFSGAAVGRFDPRPGNPVPQPVPFSHKLHAGELGLDCRYCHAAVEQAAYAGIPPTETCMTCHSQIKTDSPLLEPVRQSWETGEPIRWNRVVQVPDFVYFNHSIHVQKGVGCATCHGPVQEMDVVYVDPEPVRMDPAAQPFQMLFCLNCHRAPERFIRPREEVFNMSYQFPENQLELGARLVEAHGIRKEGLTNCSVCHR